MHVGAIMDMSDEEFKIFWKEHNEYKIQQEQWVEIHQQYEDCPDCMALIKVVVEKQPSSGNIRTKLLFQEHRV
jgi:hypothetical protein